MRTVCTYLDVLNEVCSDKLHMFMTMVIWVIMSHTGGPQLFRHLTFVQPALLYSIFSHP